MEPFERWIDQRREDFPRPVGPEIHHHEAVAGGHSRVAADRRGDDEFVCESGGVCRRHGRGRVIGVIALAQCDGPISGLDPLPALVTVHRIVATAHARHGNTGFGQRGEELG